MAFPSSPPSLDIDVDIDIDPPSSPPMYPYLPAHQSFTRKRPFSDYSPSSDPVFSEGSSTDADGEDTSDERRTKKRAVRGPWWNLTPRQAKMPAIRRAGQGKWKDSGVFMGSDDSNLDLSTTKAVDPENISSAEIIARTRIQKSLDSNAQTVDLSGLNLATLSNSTLVPLHYLLRPQLATNSSFAPSSDAYFAPLTPKLELYLSGNALTSLPTELFRLTSLTVLSLRNNQLTSLPPGLGRLTNLRELNLSGNQLATLPADILPLLQRPDTRVTLRPNPFLDPGSHERRSLPNDRRGPSRSRSASACAMAAEPNAMDQDRGVTSAVLRPDRRTSQTSSPERCGEQRGAGASGRHAGGREECAFALRARAATAASDARSLQFPGDGVFGLHLLGRAAGSGCCGDGRRGVCGLWEDGAGEAGGVGGVVARLESAG